MCMQCVAGAMTAGAAATGGRVWLTSRSFVWLTVRRRVFLTRGLVVGGVIAAGLVGPTTF